MDNHTLDYTYEKLWLAVKALAAGTGPIRQRIEYAVIPHFTVLEKADFDIEFHADFKAVEAALDLDVSRDDGSIKATLQAMDEDAAGRIAEHIFRLFCKVAQERGRRYDD